MNGKKPVKVVLPGDVVGEIKDDCNFILGPGVIQMNRNVVATKAGVLRTKGPNCIYVENSQKRYVPVQDENVIGIVTERYSEDYRVDIGTNFPATLNCLAFEGATKKNRPNLQIGSLVYGRLSLADKDMEPELTCLPKSKSETLGPLQAGFVFSCSSCLCRSLLDANNPVLAALGKRLPFEIAVGLNGRVWVNSSLVANTMAVWNSIQSAEFVPESQIHEHVAQQLRHLSL